jgi:hypothetical protein
MLYVVTVYRSPIGNFIQFIKGIDNIINSLSKSNRDITLCSDINVNFFIEDCNKRQILDNILATYNLVSIKEYPTRMAKGCDLAIDNIYIDKTHIWSYTVCPVINGLSDHDAQVIRLENVLIHKQLSETRIVRNFGKYSVMGFFILAMQLHYRRLILLFNTTYTATCFGRMTIFKKEYIIS